MFNFIFRKRLNYFDAVSLAIVVGLWKVSVVAAIIVLVLFPIISCVCEERVK